MLRFLLISKRSLSLGLNEPLSRKRDAATEEKHDEVATVLLASVSVMFSELNEPMTRKHDAMQEGIC